MNEIHSLGSLLPTNYIDVSASRALTKMLRPEPLYCIEGGFRAKAMEKLADRGRYTAVEARIHETQLMLTDQRFANRESSIETVESFVQVPIDKLRLPRHPQRETFAVVPRDPETGKANFCLAPPLTVDESYTILDGAFRYKGMLTAGVKTCLVNIIRKKE